MRRQTNSEIAQKQEESPLREECIDEFSNPEDKPILTIPKPKVKGRFSEGLVRTITGFSIFFLLIFLTFMGHFYLVLFVFFIMAMIFSEIISLKRNYLKEEPVKINTKLNWYFFFLGATFFTFQYAFEHLTQSSVPYIRFLAERKSMVFFLLYMGGFMAWVASLRGGYLRYQTRLFFWTHCVLIVTFVGSAAVYAINYGMIWWITSIVLVVVNDTGAYVVGKKFGRTKLISISPNKTLEGFFGGFLITQLLAFGWNRALLKIPFLHFWYCPQAAITLIPFNTPTCAIPSIYLPRDMFIPILSSIIGKISVSEFEIHCFILAIFASFIAPFGGFFASAIKRGLKIKDFSNNLPGHGGFTDRFDCQIIMNIFLYIYLRDVVQGGLNSLTSVMAYITRLTIDDQIMLKAQLERIINKKMGTSSS